MSNVGMSVGYICTDPFVNGNNAVHFKVATKIGYDTEKKRDKIAFVPVVVFGLSEAQRNIITKGKLVCVTGHIEEFRFKKGEETIWKTELVAHKHQIRLLGGGGSSNANSNNQPASDENHLGMDPDKDFPF